MKISLALGPRQPLSRQTAWGCVTTNLAMPGFGSLMAGYRSGYPQAVLGLGGLGLTAFYAARFFAWFLAHRAALQQPDPADPLAGLAALWQAARWPLLGFSVFLAGWLWALVTSRRILREAKSAERPIPPPLSNSGSVLEN